MRKTKEELMCPILLAFSVSADRLVAWCPYCAQWHYHGGEGHRIAHCINPQSPFKETGYIIKKGDRQDYELSNRHTLAAFSYPSEAFYMKGE